MKNKFDLLAYLFLVIVLMSLIFQSCTRENLCNCESDLVDSRDDEVYKVTPIDGLCWMKENLRYIPTANQGERFCYDNSSECDKYGGLYTWATATQENSGKGVRGICPEGWRLPIKEEIKELADLSRAELTSVCPSHNNSIFSASYPGYRTRGQGSYKGQYEEGTDCPSDLHAYFHTSTNASDTTSYFFHIKKEDIGINARPITRLKETANSIRCVCEIEMEM